MTAPRPSLWPDDIPRWPRLLLAMLIAPAILVALGAGLSFVIAGASEETREGTMAVTRNATITFAVLAGLLLLLAGLPGVATLWALGERRVFAWSVAGAVLGAAASALLGLAQHGQVTPAGLAVGTVFCWLMFLLIRAIAGIRTR
ncbi:hypothetical protein M1105_03255 [Limibaculum sp. FT325]|uniref:hypothetical protein n=1 Tax=Thermohalobaculum sediminis TaxID=2939436 RepID=UPI0020C15785|nr:hypothetical protein [Limibaculum sediminis]MCL5776019.1 hypothetical protein [Limibaculum sediminis]